MLTFRTRLASVDPLCQCTEDVMNAFLHHQENNTHYTTEPCDINVNVILKKSSMETLKSPSCLKIYLAMAENCCIEIDGRLNDINRLMNDISMITWVKKLSASSDVFIGEFTHLRRLECQAELSLYSTIDSSILDIAVYLEDRETVLSQRGWFSVKEYKTCMDERCDLDMDAVLEAAGQRRNLFFFV